MRALLELLIVGLIVLWFWRSILGLQRDYDRQVQARARFFERYPEDVGRMLRSIRRGVLLGWLIEGVFVCGLLLVALAVVLLIGR
jgi:hypothetical protein